MKKMFLNTQLGYEIKGKVLKSFNFPFNTFLFSLNQSIVVFLLIMLPSLQSSLAADNTINKKSLSANSSAVVYNLTDLNLADGANVPSAELGKFGTLSGGLGSIIYKKDVDGDYVSLKGLQNAADLVPSLGFVMPTYTTNLTVTVEYNLRISEGALVNDKYFTSGFDDGKQAPGFDNFLIRNIFNNNCQMSAMVNPFTFSHAAQSPYELEGGIKNNKRTS